MILCCLCGHSSRIASCPVHFHRNHLADISEPYCTAAFSLIHIHFDFVHNCYVLSRIIPNLSNITLSSTCRAFSGYSHATGPSIVDFEYDFGNTYDCFKTKYLFPNKNNYCGSHCFYFGLAYTKNHCTTHSINNLRYIDLTDHSCFPAFNVCTRFSY